MTVLSLHKAKPADDVVQGLRRLADIIEAGEIDWPVTTAIVCLGHTGSEGPPDSDGVCYQRNHWATYGYGPRTDSFTVKGLLATVIHEEWDG